jgi:hypothetical protein
VSKSYADSAAREHGKRVATLENPQGRWQRQRAHRRLDLRMGARIDDSSGLSQRLSAAR